MPKTPLQSEYASRINDLKDARKEILGKNKNIENAWKLADEDYIPHKLGKSGRKWLVQDDDLGLASASRYVDIGGKQWQSDAATLNPYIKIQTALSILIARNPSVDLNPSCEKYEQTTLLQKELYRKSWEVAKSLQQLKLFAFNLAKYGWSIARTYPRIVKNNSKVISEFNPDEPYNSKYENTESVEFNGVYRENLDPWLSWIDDKATPNNPMSRRDWCFAKWTPYKQLEKEYGKTKNWKYIKKGASADDIDSGSEHIKEYVSKDMKLAYYYENLDDDVLTMIIDGIPIIEIPLPVSDTKGNKKLSCWDAYWTLRHAEIPYGIGINEAIRNDKVLYDKFRNMTVDQVILSIYKMFFYQGTDQIDGSGNIKISPGEGKQVVNPREINWLDVPGAGKEAWDGIEMMQKAIDEASGISPNLEGEITGKTAFENAQATEFALRRLGTPLGNITDALEQDAQITMSINEMIYSIPEVITITNPDLIQAYYEEIKGNTELYGRDEQGNFQAKLYPEIQVNLDEDEQGRLVESDEAKFFRPLPGALKWDGIIRVKGQSMIVETKTLQKQMTLELFNLIVPLLAQPMEIALKPIKQLLKKYEIDWKDWVPDAWLIEQPQQQQQSLFIPQEQGMQGRQSLVPRSQTSPTNQSNAVNRMAGMFKRPAMSMAR
jgi:hypothetical protein